jgi:hypothetical protein
MDQDLLGYLLDALDPEATAAMERHLETSAEARRKLMALRQALQPLSHDSEPPLPPPNLVWNTIRRLAQRECSTEAPPRVLTLPRERSGGRGLWHRPDVLVAASIAFVALLLVPPALLYVRDRQHRVACANNLKEVYSGLQAWARANGDHLPGPEPQGPCARAGMMMVKLKEDGLLDGRKLVNCPANNVSRPPYIPSSEELRGRFGRADYDDLVRKMGGCYAYHMGHVDQMNQLQPISLTDDKLIPIMADRPPRPEEGVGWNVANSPNHSGRGQNVLHLGGNVQFLPTRFIDRDDIYLTTDRRMKAGRPKDHVLAPSETTPLGD